MAPYFLSIYSHLCVGVDRVVILDLASNSYWELPMAEARKLSGWVQDWPVSGVRPDKPEILGELLAASILTDDATQGRVGNLIAKAIEPSDAVEDHMDVDVSIGARDVARFITAIVISAIALRCLPMRYVIAFARRRKMRADPFEIERVPHIVAKYESLYSWILDKRDECLRNSFSLFVFFSLYGIVPDWVFGVRPAPFLAHCWLQHRHIVINDHVRSTACLMPILVV